MITSLCAIQLSFYYPYSFAKIYIGHALRWTVSWKLCAYDSSVYWQRSSALSCFLYVGNVPLCWAIFCVLAMLHGAGDFSLYWPRSFTLATFLYTGNVPLRCAVFRVLATILCTGDFSLRWPFLSMGENMVSGAHGSLYLLSFLFLCAKCRSLKVISQCFLTINY